MFLYDKKKVFIEKYFSYIYSLLGFLTKNVYYNIEILP